MVLLLWYSVTFALCYANTMWCLHCTADFKPKNLGEKSSYSHLRCILWMPPTWFVVHCCRGHRIWMSWKNNCGLTVSTVMAVNLGEPVRKNGQTGSWQRHYGPMLKMRDGMSVIVFGNVAARKGQTQMTFGCGCVDTNVIGVRLRSSASVWRRAWVNVASCFWWWCFLWSACLSSILAEHCQGFLQPSHHHQNMRLVLSWCIQGLQVTPRFSTPLVNNLSLWHVVVM